MFDLSLISSPASTDTERPLAPARALLTPTWIASLALLAANDHLLKGSGLLPGVVTGKLSDFAGMIVAPVLLAVLLRVRSRRALLACHLAVGFVFAGIQLSPSFAASWSALMGALGHPWIITCDPTDLIALPTLALAWYLLEPEMDGSLPMLTPLRRSFAGALSLFGLWSTVATSEGDPGIDFDDTWFEDVNGNLFVNNANDHDIALFVRPLRNDLDIDCLQVAQDPGRMLRPEAFGEAEHWLLPARTNVALSLQGGHTCGAAWIAGEGIAPTLIFVEQLANYPTQWFGGQSFDPEFLGDAGMGLVFGEGGSEWVGGEQLRFVPRDEAPELPEACEPAPAETRLDWSPVSQMFNELVAIEPGIDGCFELTLAPVDMMTGPLAEPYTWYLCTPDEGAPFEPGELLELRTSTDPVGAATLDITLLNPNTFLAARDEEGLIVRHVQYIRGGTYLSAISGLVERELVAVPTVTCPWATEPGCATVERPLQLAVAGAQSYLEPGEPVAFGGDLMLHTAILTHARERAVIDHQCAVNPGNDGLDVDMVIIDEPL